MRLLNATIHYNSAVLSILPTFVDVPADAFYSDAVAWAVENGISVPAVALSLPKVTASVHRS